MSLETFCLIFKIIWVISLSFFFLFKRTIWELNDISVSSWKSMTLDIDLKEQKKYLDKNIIFDIFEKRILIIEKEKNSSSLLLVHDQ